MYLFDQYCILNSIITADRTITNSIKETSGESLKTVLATTPTRAEKAIPTTTSLNALMKPLTTLDISVIIAKHLYGCYEFDLKKPTTRAIATITRSIIPTKAMNGFIGISAHMIIPPMTTKIRAITRLNTASIIPLKVHTSTY
jgi:hypothetical protein